jgi:hypothetical protein
MKKRLLYIIFISSLHFLSSCSFYYSTVSLDQKIKTASNQSNDNFNNLNLEIAELNHQISAMKCDGNTEPFKTMLSHWEEVSKSLETLLSTKNKINAEYNSFQEITKGKDRIYSNSSEWKSIKKIKKRLKSELKDFQTNGEEMVKLSETLNDYILKSVVPVVQYCDVALYTKKYGQMIDSLSQDQIELSKQLKQLQSQLDIVYAKYNATNPLICQDIKDVYGSIITEKNNLKSLADEIAQSYKLFQSKTSGMQKIYSCSQEWSIIASVELELVQTQQKLNTIQLNLESMYNEIELKISGLN